MGVNYNTSIVKDGLRHCFDLNNIKLYTTGSTVKDAITNEQGSNGIANSAVSWMNDGVYAITLVAIVTRLQPLAGYSVNPFTKYAGTTNNTFNLYMFGNFNGTAPSSDGVLRYYSNINGTWASVGSGYSCALNETVIFSLQYNSINGGQTWVNGAKAGSRNGSGRLGSVGNTSNLVVASPSYTPALRLESAIIYDRELSDNEMTHNYRALKNRYGIQ